MTYQDALDSSDCSFSLFKSSATQKMAWNCQNHFWRDRKPSRLVDWSRCFSEHSPTIGDHRGLKETAKRACKDANTSEDRARMWGRVDGWVRRGRRMILEFTVQECERECISTMWILSRIMTYLEFTVQECERELLKRENQWKKCAAALTYAT